MTSGKRLTPTEVTGVLNAMVKGGGMHTIGKLTHHSCATITEICKDFPLWNYVRKHTENDDGSDS